MGSSACEIVFFHGCHKKKIHEKTPEFLLTTAPCEQKKHTSTANCPFTILNRTAVYKKKKKKFCQYQKNWYFCTRFQKKSSSLSYGVTVAHLTLDQLV